MKLIIQLIGVLLIIILLISGFYFVFFYSENTNDDIDPIDNEEPKIDSITGNIDGITGKIVTILVSFSDNTKVTEANFYYRRADSNNWIKQSILSGSIDFKIPSESVIDYFYYVTVDDYMGNGPVGRPSTDGSTYFTIKVSEPIIELSHNVFIEEATASWCPNCPTVGEVLNDLLEDGTYNFYYVSLVEDENSKAKNRLENEYNIYGYPTVYIDGGYKVIVGGSKEKEDIDVTEYIDAIISAENRSLPEIELKNKVTYENNSESFSVEIIINNYEDETYNGNLKVYLTEIISNWNDYNGGRYHYGFLDYIIEESVAIPSKENHTSQKNWDLSNLDPENLMIIAVVFNSESEKRYSNPEENEKPFDAYFADATNGSRLIAGGNLPPEVGITNIVEGKLHFRGTPIINTLFQNTILLGKTTITVQASDDSEVERVEFYIDDILIETKKEEPYQFTITKQNPIKSLLPRKHIIMIKAYDDEGKPVTTQREVLVRI